MHRRNFLKTCTGLCIGGLGLTNVVSSCASVYYVSTGITDNKVVVKKSEFISENGKPREFVMVQVNGVQHAICLRKVNESEYLALYMECTHRGCEVRPQENYFVCPCHGSEFTATGEVQNPPAEESLKKYNTRSDETNIYISL
jgi:Rieske Fe-S protein